MNERPILYSPAMIRARNEGRKTMTRRVVNPQPDESINSLHGGEFTKRAPYDLVCPETGFKTGFGFEDESRMWQCPYGQPGDRLIVKEDAWMWCAKVISGLTTKTGKPKVCWVESLNVLPIYCADHPEKPQHIPEGESQRVGHLEYCWRKKIGRFLPRWASRGLDEITGVRIERLQDISEADAIAEGIEQIPDATPDGPLYLAPIVTADPFEPLFDKARDAYQALWDSINGKPQPGKPDVSWSANPFVWVVTFKRSSQ